MIHSDAASPGVQLINEVARLFPFFLENPVDREFCQGTAAVVVIEPDGRIHGQIFGSDKSRGRVSFGLANRKLIQVWCTGYATGHFEKLVYAGQLDEGQFGVNRPDFIGWEGGVPFELADGSLLAAAFSGFPGASDIEILVRAAAAVPGLRVRSNGK